MIKKSDDEITLIVGAGITGLTGAYCMARGGEPCLLCEAADAVGGLCRTYTIDGIPFDLGPHVFFDDPDADVNHFTTELLKDEDILSRPYRFAIHAEGRYWKFPISIWEVMKYPWRYQKELIRIVLKSRNGKRPDSESLETFITEKSGPLFYERLFEDLIEKKTLIPGTALHHDWWLRTERNVHNEVLPFVPPIKAGRLMERIMRKLFPWYNYPQKGYGRIPEILLEKYEAVGGKTLLNCGPIELERDENRIRSAVVNGNRYQVRNLIWTGSVNRLNQLLNADVPPLPHVKMIIACLTFEKNDYRERPYIYTYHPQKDIIFNRIYYPSNIYENLHPDREGLCFELNVSDDIKDLPEEKILERILEGTEKLGFYKPEALRQKELFVLRDSLPVYDLDYKDKLKASYAEVAKIENLYAVGRMGGHFFCLAPSAINQGLKISKHLSGC